MARIINFTDTPDYPIFPSNKNQRFTRGELSTLLFGVPKFLRLNEFNVLVVDARQAGEPNARATQLAGELIAAELLPSIIRGYAIVLALEECPERIDI